MKEENMTRGGSWRREFRCVGTEEQLNGHSCGVYALMAAAHVISADTSRDLSWRQADIEPYCRQAIALAISQKKLHVPGTGGDRFLP